MERRFIVDTRSQEFIVLSKTELYSDIMERDEINNSTPLTGITLTSNKSVMNIGEKGLKIMVVTTPIDAISRRGFTFNSSDEDILDINDNGELVAKQLGKSTITVTSIDTPAVSEELEFEIVVNVATGIALSNGHIFNNALIIGGPTSQIHVEPIPADAVISGYDYSSDNHNVFTVSTTGLLTPVKAGEATITVTSKDDASVFNEFKVSVRTPDITGFNNTIKSTTLTIGDNMQVVTKNVPANAVNTTPYLYTTSNPSIISVSKDGMLTAHKIGSVTLYTKTDHTTVVRSDIINCSAIAELTGIDISNGPSVIVGEHEQIHVHRTPVNGDIGSGIEYTSSNIAVAEINDKGLLVVKATGTTVITATSKDDASITDTLTITATNPVLTDFTATATPVTLGNTSQIAVKGITPARAEVGQGYTYASSNTSIATVSTGGLITGVALGKFTITVTSVDTNTVKSVLHDTVVAPVLTNINITGNHSIKVGEHETLTAHAVPSGSLVPKGYTFTSSEVKLATVTNSGVVTGVAVGSVTITITSNDNPKISHTVNVIITKPDITAVTVGNKSVAVGATTKLSVRHLPSVAEVGAGFTYSSSATSIATVNTSGVVTGVAAGTATITITSADKTSVSTTATITVTA